MSMGMIIVMPSSGVPEGDLTVALSRPRGIGVSPLQKWRRSSHLVCPSERVISRSRGIAGEALLSLLPTAVSTIAAVTAIAVRPIVLVEILTNVPVGPLFVVSVPLSD